MVGGWLVGWFLRFWVVYLLRGWVSRIDCDCSRITVVLSRIEGKYSRTRVALSYSDYSLSYGWEILSYMGALSYIKVVH